MSDLKDEDLLLGDDDIDQALYGADEDELLLTDEELEKDVTSEEKKQMKAEAEQWVREQMQEKQKRPQKNKTNGGANSKKLSENVASPATPTKNFTAAATTNEVSSTANNSIINIVASNALPTAGGDDVTTSESVVHNVATEFKTPPTQSTSSPAIHLEFLNANMLSITANADDAISSSSKDGDMEHMSMISCSTTENPTDSSVLASSQESLTSIGIGGVGGVYADPREDCEEEREERTNIKTTNERELESASSSDQSPDKHHRYGQNKRFPGDNFNPMIRPHRYPSRPQFYPGPRPMLNRGPFPPMPHGNFALVYASSNAVDNRIGVGVLSKTTMTSAAATATLMNTISSLSPLPGHFPPQHPAPNTPPHNMYAPAGTQHTPPTHSGIPPSPGASMNTVTPSAAYPQHDMAPRLPLRHPYPGFRPGGPMNPNFPRHPMHGNIYGPTDFNNPGPPHGPPQFGQNFMPHGPRGMYRPEMTPGMPPRLSQPPGMHMQRSPLPPPNMVGAPSFVNAPPGNTLRQPAPPQQQAPPNVITNVPGAPNQAPVGGGSVAPASSLRPSKVLINPNFKGGVEAAKSKFMQETQFMAALGGVCRSEDELLRQQEEFINKNRQHIEKRRNERATSPSTTRRSRSRSRSRTRSRERSYTPPTKRTGGDRYFERGALRGSSRERERDRERERERERDRLPYGSRPGPAGNRFRRGNSRDRVMPGEYEGRGGYSKRRRSISPSGNRGNGNSFSGRRGRSGERDRNEDEDDETRAYRLKIEKQKELREKIMRDKEMKRRRAAEEKQYEEKRAVPQGNTQSNVAGSSHNANNKPSNSSNNNSSNNQNSYDEPQKLKPIIVTQPKIISLKKRQQANESGNEREFERERTREQRQHMRGATPPNAPTQRRQLPTAKILPEAKRTLTEHLTGSSSSGGGGGGGSSSSGSHQHNNTAIIKPVQKTRETSRRLTPPLPASSASLPSKHTRRLSTPSDDEVQLDCDDDELMLDEEDRLLASPTPSPKHRSAATAAMISRTPSPEPPPQYTTIKTKTQKSSTSSSGATAFTSSNRRVVLKSSNQASTSESSSRNRRGNSRQRESTISSQSTRKGIFDRLDVRSGGGGGGGSSILSADSKRKAHRIVLKHD